MNDVKLYKIFIAVDWLPNSVIILTDLKKLETI